MPYCIFNGEFALLCERWTKAGLRKAMSKKDKKIKSLKKELKALKAELRKLKSAARRRRRSKAAKAPKPKPQAPARTDIDTPPQMAAALKSISAVRPVGQR
jgi:septal ring factor EnvC (AmiA/AmiB activator)